MLIFFQVDLSGQSEMGAEGWVYISNGFKMCSEKHQNLVRLKVLVLANCKLKGVSKTMIEETLVGVRIEFGKEDEDNERTNQWSCC